MAIRVWPAGPARRKNAGRAKIVGPRGLGPHRPAACAGQPASPHKIK